MRGKRREAATRWDGATKIFCFSPFFTLLHAPGDSKSDNGEFSVRKRRQFQHSAQKFSTTTIHILCSYFMVVYSHRRQAKQQENIFVRKKLRKKSSLTPPQLQFFATPYVEYFYTFMYVELLRGEKSTKFSTRERLTKVWSCSTKELRRNLNCKLDFPSWLAYSFLSVFFPFFLASTLQIQISFSSLCLLSSCMCK